MIELAVVLFIIALVLGSILVPLTTQVEQRQISDTQKTMEEIREVLIGFAIANSYLPCPDTTGDGVSDPATPGICPNVEGFVPWATLSVARGDAWGNRFRYRVTSEFTNTPVATCATGDGRLGLCDSGNITVNTRTSTKTIQALASNVVAVIISHGKNGYGATSTAGAAIASVPVANVDEASNVDSNATFVYRTPTGVSSPCSDSVVGQTYCEFDDIVAWLSAFTLFNRMVSAGKLP
jgi:type II secretory pathway pseudopilin PulG